MDGFAQSIDFRGPRPTALLLNQYNEPIYIYACVSGQQIYASPDSGHAQGLRAAKYLERFALLKKESVGGKNYLLVGKTNFDMTAVEKISGWVLEDDCVTDLSAMRTEDSIYRKALIINRWNYGKDASGRLDVATVHKGPGSSYPKMLDLGLFQFFYVWKKRGSGQNGFWLIGTKPYLESYLRPQETILGWVSTSRILEWNTRQAIEFNKANLDQRTEPVVIFKEKRNLTAWVEGRAGTTEPIAKEVMSVKKWDPSWPRFPLISADRQQASRGHSSQGLNFMKVAYIGDQVAVDSGRFIRTSRDTATVGRKLETLKNMARKIDILLVIDATGSMYEFFRPVANAIENTFRQLDQSYGEATKSKPDIFFSVLFYRDYYNPKTLVKQKQLTKDYKEVVRFIREEPVRPGEGANPKDRYELTEAMFNGVCTGLENIRFRDGSYRLVIVIGDRGNHPAGKDQRGLTERQVVDSLANYDASLIALHTASPEQLKYDDQAQLFASQMKRIKSMLEAKNRNSISCKYLHQPRGSAVAKQIVSGCEQATRLSDRIVNALNDIQSGDSLHVVKQKHGVVIASRLREMMEKVGLKPEDFQKSGAQICEIGWLTECNPRSREPQVETVLLVRKEEIERLHYVVNMLTKREASTSKRKVSDMWKKELQQEIGGEFDMRTTMDTYISMHLGLPIRKKLLKFSLDDIGKMNPRELMQLRKQLTKERDNLYNLLSGDKRSVWFRHQDIEYAWINREDLP